MKSKFLMADKDWYLVPLELCKEFIRWRSFKWFIDLGVLSKKEIEESLQFDISEDYSRFKITSPEDYVVEVLCS